MKDLGLPVVLRNLKQILIKAELTFLKNDDNWVTLLK